MAILVSKSEAKKFYLFLNISFLFLLSFYLTTQLNPSPNHLLLNPSTTPILSPSLLSNDTSDDCSDLHKFEGYESKCAYVKSNTQCQSDGYINYLSIFYCNFGRYPAIGYIVLFLWLILLFYLLGNTAAKYFCSSLDSLSTILKLSPSIAGVTLLSLGNGGPDVFSSIVSFTSSGTGNVGLNSVLGGAFFVSSFVVGIISICVGPRQISVDKSCFIRDICFFILTLSSLFVILIIGRINLWGAIAFTSLYFAYVFISTTNFCRKKEKEIGQFPIDPILPITGKFFLDESAELGELGVPLLNSIHSEKPISTVKEAIGDGDQNGRTSWFTLNSSVTYYIGWLLYLLELPLYLPRRLTIPVVSEETWSKPFAVVSVTLAPVLSAALWTTHQGDMGFKATLAIYLSGGFIGIILGVTAYLTTESSCPPKSCLFPWLAGGFLMSMIWTYITAEELVALLVSLGYMFEISSSILGLTVLAWGNSIGDLIANVAMAMTVGPDGAQVAISGCYAGPIFNTLMGLGLSLVLSAWSAYPSSCSIPKDSSLYETLGFLMGGLLWALVILPRKDMKLDKFLGVGLLAIYTCFLSIRLVWALGII